MRCFCNELVAVVRAALQRQSGAEKLTPKGKRENHVDGLPAGDPAT